MGVRTAARTLIYVCAGPGCCMLSHLRNAKADFEWKSSICFPRSFLQHSKAA